MQVHMTFAGFEWGSSRSFFCVTVQCFGSGFVPRVLFGVKALCSGFACAMKQITILRKPEQTKVRGGIVDVKSPSMTLAY